MKNKHFILSILKKIETLQPSLIAYAYKDSNDLGNKWWVIGVNDYLFYMKNERFNMLRKAWYKSGRARKITIIFAFCNLREKKMQELYNENNLLINI